MFIHVRKMRHERDATLRIYFRKGLIFIQIGCLMATYTELHILQQPSRRHSTCDLVKWDDLMWYVLRSWMQKLHCLTSTQVTCTRSNKLKRECSCALSAKDDLRRLSNSVLCFTAAALKGTSGSDTSANLTNSLLMSPGKISKVWK